MSGFAEAAPTEGLVQWELTIEEARQVCQMLRVGIAAWEASPTASAVDEALRPKGVRERTRLLDELATLAAAAHERQESAFRAQSSTRSRKRRRP